MARITENAEEQTNNSLPEAMEETLRSEVVMHAGYPTFVCGVNRKVNTGNYENIDVYAGVTIPLIGILPEDIETFKKAVTDAAELGFWIVSEETGSRYALIKESQKSGRQPK